MQKVIDEEATYEESYMTWKKNEPVSKDIFMKTPEEERFCFLRRINGVKPEFEKNNNWKRYREFQMFYRFILPHYLEGFLGLSLNLVVDVTHSLQNIHYLKKHNDYETNRKVCTILYLSQDWRPEYGGELHMACNEPDEKIIHPQYNRLLIFFPNKKIRHYVARHTEAAKHKTRTCHVAWYGI